MDTSVDVNFLREKCESDTVTVVADGRIRDRRINPNPADYVLTMQEPIKLVYGYDILDATIPSTIFNVNDRNDALSYWTTTSAQAALSPDLLKAIAATAVDPTSVLSAAMARAAASSLGMTSIPTDEPILEFDAVPNDTEILPGQDVGSVVVAPRAGAPSLTIRQSERGEKTTLSGVPASAVTVGRLFAANNVAISSSDTTTTLRNVSVQNARVTSVVAGGGGNAGSNAQSMFDRFLAGTAPPGVGVAVIGLSSDVGIGLSSDVGIGLSSDIGGRRDATAVDFWGYDPDADGISLVPPLVQTVRTPIGIIGPGGSTCCFGPSVCFVDAGRLARFLPDGVDASTAVCEMLSARLVELEDCDTCGKRIGAHRRKCARYCNHHHHDQLCPHHHHPHHRLHHCHRDVETGGADDDDIPATAAAANVFVSTSPAGTDIDRHRRHHHYHHHHRHSHHHHQNFLDAAVAPTLMPPPDEDGFEAAAASRTSYVSSTNDIYSWDATSLARKGVWSSSAFAGVDAVATLGGTGAAACSSGALILFDVRDGAIKATLENGLGPPVRKLRVVSNEGRRRGRNVDNPEKIVVGVVALAGTRASVRIFGDETGGHGRELFDDVADIDFDASTSTLYIARHNQPSSEFRLFAVDLFALPHETGPVIAVDVDERIDSVGIACNARTMAVALGSTSASITYTMILKKPPPPPPSCHPPPPNVGVFSIVSQPPVVVPSLAGSFETLRIDSVLHRVCIVGASRTTTTEPGVVVLDASGAVATGVTKTEALCGTANVASAGFIYCRNFVTRVRHAYYASSADFVGVWNAVDPNLIASVDALSSRLLLHARPTLLSTNAAGNRQVGPASPLLAAFAPSRTIGSFFVDLNASTIKDMLGMGNTPDPIVASTAGCMLRSIGTCSFSKIAHVVLRCQEIEEHVFREDVPGSAGIGIFKILDVNDVLNFRFDFVNFVRRPFHPISQLPKLTFRFENTDGSLCDFNGSPALLIIGIKRYMPRPPGDFGTSYVLNPNYDPDYREYHLRAMELSQFSSAQRLQMPTRDAFVREHNLHAVDPRRRLPLYEDVQDNIDDDDVDDDKDEVSTKASSIWTDDDDGSSSVATTSSFLDFFR